MAPGQLVCRLVRFQLKQLFMAVRKHTPGGEIASRLAYTQKSRGQNLPGRPFLNASLHNQQCAASRGRISIFEQLSH